MTQATEAGYYNWQQHSPAPDPSFSHCSPNLGRIFEWMTKRWACNDVGCYGVRPIRNGVAMSTHGFGAARDIRYRWAGRNVAVTEILPWLIDNSQELHISAIHDYLASRIWHAGRGWKAQTPNPSTGMGQSWADYFHIEVNRDGWGDGSTLESRGVLTTPPDPTTPDPTPPPQPSTPGVVYVHTTVQNGSTGSEVYGLQAVLRKGASQTNVIVDGNFGPVTETGLKTFQHWFGLTEDGICGPKTWAKVDEVANT
jgi:hypothetical protein